MISSTPFWESLPAERRASPLWPFISPGGGDLLIGSFLNAVLNFLIMAFVVFCLVKSINKFHRKKEKAAPPPAPPEPSAEERLLTEIRDLLKERG